MTNRATINTPNDESPPHRYTAALAGEIEPRWQKHWLESGAFRAPNPGDPGFDPAAPRFYALDMFPYPSGAGLHVGHPEGYTATDIVSRYKRLRGFNVLHPMGWDAFGLPAEQYAIQTGVHPAITTRTSVNNFRRQLQRFGFTYDWDRELGTIDEEYYRWTQWIFLKIRDAWFDPDQNKARPISEFVAEMESGRFGVTADGSRVRLDDAHASGGARAWSELTDTERADVIDHHRLAYQAQTMVNWCPKLGTVLANDEVIDGKSERGGFPVLRKPLNQWMFRITAYADRLLAQLDQLDWPTSTKAMQAEWIGKSTGAEIDFRLGTPTLRVGQSTADLIRAIDAEPSHFQRPKHFVARDPYPPGTSGAVRDLMRSDRFLPHIRLPSATYFVTWTCADGVTLDDDERATVLAALRHFEGQRCQVYAACVMNNHVHWLVRPFDGHDLTELCESVKHFSATSINKRRRTRGRLWSPEAFDHIVRHGGFFADYLAYLVRNPAEARIVSDPAAYQYTFVHEDVVGDPPHAERGGTPQGTLRVFTTRPDTLFGATYMVVAPEHELCERVIRGQAEVDANTAAALKAYCDSARNRSDVERQENKKKTGVFTGILAINPATGDRIPVWAADYVLMGYGTGAIMAVPAHDERDFEFAREFGLPIRDVVYSRAVQAMKHFAEHADPAEQADDRWAGTLADMLGAAVSIGASPAAALERVRTGRTQGQAPGKERRGSIRGEWLDTIRELALTSFADLRERFRDACFHERAGNAAPEPGFAVNSSNSEVSLDGLGRTEATAAIIAWLERRGLGRGKTNFRLRDWTFSRQRYWGEPFPIVFDPAGRAYPVHESKLPVRLPELADYAPIESDDPQPLLAKARAWTHTTAGEAGVDPALLPPDTPVTRETNTMPGSAGSSWYAIRYCDAKNPSRFAGRDAERYWMGGPGPIGGVDLYLGGSEHAVGHLLYSRFWQNVLFDLGEVSTPEPFRRLVHQGLITSFAYQRADKSIVPTDEVREAHDPAHPDRATYVEIATGAPVTPIVTKMSKRYKNVVNPDDVIAEYGADTCRLYEMYMGPLEASKPWNPRDITGCFRFLQRAWRLAIDERTGLPRLSAGPDPEIEKRLHRVIAKVEADIERLAFNTAIAAMIEFVNAAGAGPIAEDQLAWFMIVLSPFAPHLAEEVWHRLGRAGSVARAGWPAFDPAMLVDDHVELAVQVLGKVRGKVVVPSGADAAAVEAIVRAEPRLNDWLAGKSITKVIVVPGRLVNVVVR